jgi:protein TonB
MKKFPILLIGLFTCVRSFSQGQETNSPDSLKTEEEVFSVVAIMPQFPGGQDSLTRYISEQLNYPAACVENSIQGTIVVSFIVEKDGQTSDHNIIRTVSYGGELNREALRICKTLHFEPGSQYGQPVRVRMNLPIEFSLKQERKKQKEK